jgi:hypothetical protein
MTSSLISLGLSAVLLAAYWGFKRLGSRSSTESPGGQQLGVEFEKILSFAPDRSRGRFRQLMAVRSVTGAALVAGICFFLVGAIAREARTALFGWFLWMVSAFAPLLIDGLAALTLGAILSTPIPYLGKPRILVGGAAIRFGWQRTTLGLICMFFAVALSVIAARAIL